jgi:hypothetical protein
MSREGYLTDEGHYFLLKYALSLNNFLIIYLGEIWDRKALSDKPSFVGVLRCYWLNFIIKMGLGSVHNIYNVNSF